jgi:hypothetical protein
MRPALLLLLLLAPFLGACGSSPSADGETGGGRRGAADAEHVARIQVQYMTAGDLAAVLEHSFRRGLWVRVENRTRRSNSAQDAVLEPTP